MPDDDKELALKALQKRNEGSAGAREAADPVVQIYHGRYYLFASKSKGYWSSGDMQHWQFTPCGILPIPGAEFAPYGDGLYVGGHPLGPFEHADYSPVSVKPGGWMTGAGQTYFFRVDTFNESGVTTGMLLDNSDIVLSE